jgi:hypothetical protein
LLVILEEGLSSDGWLRALFVRGFSVMCASSDGKEKT